MEFNFKPDPKPEPSEKKVKVPISKSYKAKKCAECKVVFTPKRVGEKVCSMKCAIDFGKKQLEKENTKARRKEDKEFKEKNKKKSKHVQELQIIFNKFIRIRDKDEPCISCDSEAGHFKLTAGHFWPSTYENLRFDEDNVHGQCWFNCNKNRHGNINEYRIRLIEKIGLERVERLDQERHNNPDLTKEEIIELKEIYKLKIKELNNRK